MSAVFPTAISSSGPAAAAPLASRGGAAGRVVFLDALRFIAAAAVVFQHTMERRGDLGEQLVSVLSPGVFGVALFFIISGFVMPMAAERGFDLTSFAVRRVFRIYPLLLVALLTVFLLNRAGVPSSLPLPMEGVRGWIANIFLIQDYTGYEPVLGVTWTLNLEFIWYALFAASLLLIGRRFDEWLMIVGSVGMVLAALLSLAIGHRLPLGRLGMIYAAILGCRAYRYHSGHMGARRFATEATAALAVLLLCNVISFGYFRHPSITLTQAAVPWFIAPALFLLVVGVPGMTRQPLLGGRLLGWLGTISFSIYLLHPVALRLVTAYAPEAVMIPAVVGLTIALSATGYYGVERPGQALGRVVGPAHR